MESRTIEEKLYLNPSRSNFVLIWGRITFYLKKLKVAIEMANINVYWNLINMSLFILRTVLRTVCLYAMSVRYGRLFENVCYIVTVVKFNFRWRKRYIFGSKNQNVKNFRFVISFARAFTNLPFIHLFHRNKMKAV